MMEVDNYVYIIARNLIQVSQKAIFPWSQCVSATHVQEHDVLPTHLVHDVLLLHLVQNEFFP